MATSSLDAALEVIEALEAVGVAYHLGGSLASTVHGVPRQTLDIDLVADLHNDQVDRFVSLLDERFYVDAQMVREAVEGRRSFNVVRSDSGQKVDVFVLGSEPFDQEEFRRRVRQKLLLAPPRELWVKSPEDTVLRKLLWFEAGGGVSENQWRDVVGVLKVQGDRLDAAYLDQWAVRLGIQSLLERARSEA